MVSTKIRFAPLTPPHHIKYWARPPRKTEDFRPSNQLHPVYLTTQPCHLTPQTSLKK